MELYHLTMYLLLSCWLKKYEVAYLTLLIAQPFLPTPWTWKVVILFLYYLNILKFCYQSIHLLFILFAVNDCNADSNSLDSSMKHIQRMSTRRFSDSFHAITELCLQRNPDNRPSASQLLNHAFIKQCRKSEMCLIDLLKEVTSIDNRNYESAGMSMNIIYLCLIARTFEEYNFFLTGDCATNLYAEIAKLDIESCQWDFWRFPI